MRKKSINDQRLTGKRPLSPVSPVRHSISGKSSRDLLRVDITFFSLSKAFRTSAPTFPWSTGYLRESRVIARLHKSRGSYKVNT
jgi:hypothetical protein